MVYLIAGLVVVGVVVIALSRERVEAEPVCPNCREPLESLEVDRCPNCMLWQPPEQDAPTHRWRRQQVRIGLLLVVLPPLLGLLLPIVIERTLAPEPVPLAGRPTPLSTTRPWPPALPTLTPQQLAQLRALGYLPAAPGRGVAAPTTQPAPSD